MNASRAPKSIVLRDALLVTQDANRRVVLGDLRVEEGRITHAGPERAPEAEETLDARGFAAVPGFVNAHTHVAMAPLRGYADDRDLAGFLERLFPLDAKRTEADIESGAAAGIAEMLLSGTTSFLDLYYGEDAVGRAVERLGIRGVLAWTVLDPEFTTQRGRPIDNARAFCDRWTDPRSRVTPAVGLQGVYVCGEDTVRAAVELARTRGTRLHLHLSETRREVHEHEAKTGLRPPAWLDRVGALSPETIAAHAVWLTRREIELLAQRKVGVAHCAASNLKLATGGIAPVVELREAGAAVAIGTDSNASNNSLSLLREMHVAGLAQKHHRWDGSALDAQTLLDMATLEGARVLGRETELGSLEPGKRADFSLFRLDHPTLLPARPEAVVSHLAYSASEEAVDSVYVDGECVVRRRSLVREPWDAIRREGEEAARGLWG